MAKDILYLTLVGLFVCIVIAAPNIGDPCRPDDPYEYGLYAPHPTNCSQFLQCVHNRFEARNCSPGLHWSVYYNSCQWPNAAGCNVTTPTPETPTPTDEYDTTTYYPTTDEVDTTTYYPTTYDDSAINEIYKPYIQVKRNN